MNRTRRGRERWAFDERILGDSTFVREVLERAEGESLVQPPAEPARALQDICSRASLLLGVTEEEIVSGGSEPRC